MEYKHHEIFARVCGTYSDLYHLNEDGSLGECEDIIIKNGDEEIVWYEVEAIDPERGCTTMFVELNSIEETKKVVDRSVAYSIKHSGGELTESDYEDEE